MALADSITFYHTFASITPDYPTSGLTKSNPAGSSDPSISSGIATFGTGSGGVSTTWTLTSGEFTVGGTGNFSIAVRAKFTTNTSGGNVMVHLGNTGSRGAAFREQSSASFTFRMADPAGGISSKDSDASAWSLDTYFTAVFVRDTGVSQIWVDGVEDSTANGFTGDLTGTYEDITIGSLAGGTLDLDGAIDWVAVWDRALTDSEITNNMNETDISTALGLGGGGTTKANLIKQVSRYHLGASNLGRIQRRS